MVINIFITWRWGITAIIYGQMVTVIVAHLLGTWYVWRLIGYSLWQQIKDVFVYFALSVIMYLIAVVILHFISNPVLSLTIASMAGATFYFSAASVLKLEEILEFNKIVKK